eukprot:5582550-Prymnesium_polylepis.1
MMPGELRHDDQHVHQGERAQLQRGARAAALDAHDVAHQGQEHVGRRQGEGCELDARVGR